MVEVAGDQAAIEKAKAEADEATKKAVQFCMCARVWCCVFKGCTGFVLCEGAGLVGVVW